MQQVGKLGCVLGLVRISSVVLNVESFPLPFLTVTTTKYVEIVKLQTVPAGTAVLAKASLFHKGAIVLGHERCLLQATCAKQSVEKVRFEILFANWGPPCRVVAARPETDSGTQSRIAGPLVPTHVCRDFCSLDYAQLYLASV